MAAFHTHCSSCVNLHCQEPVRLGISCDVTSCPLVCGAVFHSCKAPDHQLLCPQESVSCPNHAYGCPITMLRSRVAQHLVVCPASVVCCRHTHFPSIHPMGVENASPHTANIQMVSDPGTSHMHMASHPCFVPNKSPTNVTRIHVADSHGPSFEMKPLNLNTVTSELNAIDSSEELKPRSGGIFEDDSSFLCNITKGVSQGFQPIVTGADSGAQPIRSRRVETNNCLDQSDPTEVKGGVRNYEDHHGELHTDDLSDLHQMSISTNTECTMVQPLSDLDAFPPSYDREARLKLLQRFLPPELGARLTNPPASHPSEPIQDQRIEASASVAQPDLNEPSSDTPETKRIERLPCETFCKPAKYPTSSTTHHSIAETIPPVVPSGGSEATEQPNLCGEDSSDATMMPGVCGQLFRRDEFLWHSRNVHADLDLLERACPLASYGCPVAHRLLTTLHGASLVYHAQVRALGLCPATTTLDPVSKVPDLEPIDHLSALPLELQRHLLSYLDAFSLSQLALVSVRMREACASLLRVRGMVLLRWTRCGHDDNVKSGKDKGLVCRWKVRDKVWHFSTAFSRVESWELAEVPNLSNHLQLCAWNQVERRVEPRPLPCMSGGGGAPQQEWIKALGVQRSVGRGSARGLAHSLANATITSRGACRGCR